MSTNNKRKKAPPKKPNLKKAKRKDDTDESDLSDSGEGESTQPDEVLIAGKGFVTSLY